MRDSIGAHRILYLTPGVFDKGGISRYCRYQITALREIYGKQQIRVLSLLPPDERGLESPFSVDFASFGPTRRGKTLFGAAAVAVSLQERPSIVWSAHAHLGVLALGIARVLQSRFFQNIYGLEVWTHVSRARAMALRKADHVFSDCHATLEYVVQQELRDRTSTSVHWDCVDTKRFCPGEPGDVLQRYGVPPAGDDTTVLTLGRISREDNDYKGYGRLIEAIKRLPDAPIRLVIAGDGNGRADLQARVQAERLLDRVFFTGPVHEDDLVDVYRSCDAFSLVTSRGPGQGEGLPLTPLEASSCGKPVIVGNEDGSAELVEDGVTGFCISPRDIHALGERIRILTKNDIARSMGTAARERMVTTYDYPLFKKRLAERLTVL